MNEKFDPFIILNLVQIRYSELNLLHLSGPALYLGLIRLALRHRISNASFAVRTQQISWVFPVKVFCGQPRQVASTAVDIELREA